MAIDWRKPGGGKRTMALIYGDTGKGKTLSTLMSAPLPVRYYECQSKPVEQTCEGTLDIEKMAEEGQISVGKVTEFNDIYVDITENFEEIVKTFKTIFVDDYTYLSEYILLKEIQRETGRAGVFEKSDRPLVNEARTDMTGYGAVASHMADLTGMLGKLASAGMIVIVTALQVDEPTYNRELSAGPNLAGKKFPDTMGGFFDLVGKVQQRKNKDGDIVYPPVVYFQAPEEDFMAKWSGKPLKKPAMLLDWSKILNYKKQEK